MQIAAALLLTLSLLWQQAFPEMPDQFYIWKEWSSGRQVKFIDLQPAYWRVVEVVTWTNRTWEDEYLPEPYK